MRNRLCLAFFLLFVASSAHAVPWVFKHDQFSENLQQAANEVNGGQFYTQPGFVAGEAFGQVYKPLPEMYPMQIVGFDLILTAPPNASGPLYANATIEIYNSTSTSADPGNAPIFSISTADLFNPATQDFGFPLIGNHGISVDFGAGDPEDRPPMVTDGSIWLVIRFTDEATCPGSNWSDDFFTQFACDFGCGCQNVGTAHDNAIVGKANVLHIIHPVGQCSGNKQWVFMETVSSPELGDFRIDGDVILRLKADVASGPCVADCAGKDCGDDGCGGSCGDCGDLVCHQNECVDCAPSCISKNCGDDGCGGSCGTCGDGEICGPNQFCIDDCTPSCTGKECGPNGCGGTCGTCTGGESCSAGQCVADCVSDCTGKECGDNGCGGSCGSCPNDETCVAGECIDESCDPDCDGKDCGSDGCGGTCGSCGAGESCDAGECVADEPAFAITNVSPSSGFAMEPTAISITGTGFDSAATVKVGAIDCTNVTVTGTGLISATVPGQAVGVYAVIVVNPGGDIATMNNGFTVFPKTTVSTGNSDGGCNSTSGNALAGLLAAIGLVVGHIRARRLSG